MWSTSKYWKIGYVIKIGSLKIFSKRREAPVSGPQLKIKNQIMVYRWTFGKDSLKLEKILWAILYQTCRKLSSLIENCIMEGVRSPSPEI